MIELYEYLKEHHALVVRECIKLGRIFTVELSECLPTEVDKKKRIVELIEENQVRMRNAGTLCHKNEKLIRKELQERIDKQYEEIKAGV